MQQVDLQSLVQHSDWIESSKPLRDVYDELSKLKYDYMAVLDQGMLLGVCSKSKIGMLLGHLYGRSLYDRQPVRHYLLSNYLKITTEMQITEVLQAVFSREEYEFYDDAVLTNGQDNFLGLIPIKTLITVQNRIFMENIDTLKAQQMELNRKNKEMEKNLVLARGLQQAFLPQQYPCFPSHASETDSRLRFSHYYQSADLLGGDFFHIIPISDYAAGMFICDVMGHGVSSALVTSMLRALLESFQLLSSSPSELMEAINQKLIEMLKHNNETIFATALYLTVDTESFEYQLVRAGHHYPLHLNRASSEIKPLEHANVGGPPLGVIEGANYETHQGKIEENDVFLAYTDGLFEVFNSKKQMYGKKRLLEKIQNSSHLPPITMMDEIVMGVKNFSSSETFEDDICLVGLEIASSVHAPSPQSTDFSQIFSMSPVSRTN